MESLPRHRSGELVCRLAESDSAPASFTSMTSPVRTIEHDLRYYQSNLEPIVEMAISIQDQQKIFLAYRALFKGPNAQIRQPKKIRKVLGGSSKSSSPLVKSFGLEKIVLVLKGLLERGIFASELKAKLAFPVLYETSPEQDARHEASDAGAAREEAQALHEVEALDNAATAEASAATFDFEGTDLDEGEKLNNIVPEFEGPVSDNQGEMVSISGGRN